MKILMDLMMQDCFGEGLAKGTEVGGDGVACFVDSCRESKTNCRRMTQLSNLLLSAEQLNLVIQEWIPKRKASVRTLRALAEKLMDHHNKVCIAQVAGNAASVAGFVISAIGFGLSFVTFGASLVVAGVGFGVGAAGGVTNAGSLIAEACIQKDTLDTAQKIINEDREAAKAIEKFWKKFEKKVLESQVKNGAKAAFKSARILEFFVEIGWKLGARIARKAAGEGGEAFIRGLGSVGKVAHVGGFVFSAVLLPFDIHALVTSSMEVDASRKGQAVKEPEAVKKLRELADELEKSIPSGSDLTRELDDFISNVTSDSI